VQASRYFTLGVSLPGRLNLEKKPQSRRDKNDAALGGLIDGPSIMGQTQSTMDWQALFLTLKLDLVVCALLLLIGVPIAYWLASSRWRWKFLLDAVVALPLVLPPTVLGFYMLLAMGPKSPLGKAYFSLRGEGLPFTFCGLVMASLIYSLPFMVQPIAAAFASVDPKLTAASAVLGASRMRTFLRVVLPLSLGGLLTGVVLTFAHTLGEFGVVLMVGGNIPGVTRTVSISIYDNVQALDFSSAGQTSLVLLLASFVILSIVYAVNRPGSVLWSVRR
jgi:molybdate transport system permease protein